MKERHPIGTIVLHWAMALLILGLFALGWYMVTVPQNTPERGLLFNLHKSIGLVSILCIALFIGSRLRHAAPAYPDTMARWEIDCAKIAHHLTYVFLVVVPLSGYIEANFNRWGISFFEIWHLPPWGPNNETLQNVFGILHVYSANCFAALLSVHIGAAFKHLLVNRDHIMQRILPFW